MAACGDEADWLKRLNLLWSSVVGCRQVWLQIRVETPRVFSRAARTLARLGCTGSLSAPGMARSLWV